jgi:hypothetical protein
VSGKHVEVHEVEVRPFARETYDSYDLGTPNELELARDAVQDD